MSSSFIGVLEPFSGDDFEPYQDRLEAYFSANEIGQINDNSTEAEKKAADKKKVAHTIAVIGKDAYDTIKDLCLPEKPTEKSFDEICRLLSKYYKPSVLVVAEAYKFHQIKQEVGESVSVYANRLRRLAVNCKFDVFLQRALRDQFVCGIRNGNTLKKLLSQDKSFDECLSIAIADEAAEKESRSLAASFDATVNFTNSSWKNGKDRRQRGGKPKCFSCGSESHFADKCPLKETGGLKCTYCHKPNHLSKECFKRKSDERKKIHRIVDNKDIDSEDYAEYSEIPMFRITEEEDIEVSQDIEGPTHIINMVRQGSYKTEVVLDGESVEMEVDTGSGVTLLSRADFEKIRGKEESLQPSRLILRGYTGDKIRCLGEKLMVVEINKQVKQMVVRVVDGQGPSLLGRDLISRFILPWENIFKINSSEYSDITKKYSSLFDNSNVGKIEGLKVQLHVNSDNPIFKKARPVPYAIRSKYEESLKKLEDEGIIEKVEFSEWASPVVPVLKPNGDLRLCGDYSATINKCMISDVYPLPTLEDIINKVGYGETFTKLDLSQAFHQFELDEGSRKYTTINTLKGLYQYNRLVFGVPSATAICQRTMENILKDIEGVVVRVDDILVTGRTDEEHLKNLEVVLDKLEKKGMKLQKSKIQFMLKEVEYNGFTISKNGVKPTVQKVEAIHAAESPTNITELRSFIGLANYLRSFVPNFAEIISPLYKLLKRESKWKWDKSENDAFNKIKEAICAEKVLKRYDPNAELFLQTDASGVGVGATILQPNEKGFLQPIAYASRVLNTAERNYPQIERELLGVVFGVTKFRLFVLGRKFILQTDHKPLTRICNEHETVTQLASNRIKKWSMLLKAYDFQIKHIAGKDNVVADFLSRKPINSIISSAEQQPEYTILFIQDNETVKAECIVSETRKDSVLNKVLHYTRNGWSNDPEPEVLPYYQRRHELTIESEILLWGDRVVIPASLREILLKDLHAEHLGIVRTKQLARNYLWWPRLDADIESTVKVCRSCQEFSKSPKRSEVGMWSWPNGPWKRIHIDFAGPEKNGQMYLVVVDAYSKYLEIIPMFKTDTNKTIEKLRHLFSTFGLPEHIVSDNGPQFISEEFKIFLSKNDIQHTRTPPNHPATNGLAERYVGYWKEALKKMGDSNETLQSKLDRFLLTYRATPTHMGKSPSELLMNRKPRTRFNALKFSDTKQQVKVFQENLNQKPKFGIGDAVFAKIFGRGANWMPGKITDIISPKSYLIQVKDVLWKRHVDQLKIREIPIDDEGYEERTVEKQTNTMINHPVSVPSSSLAKSSRYHYPSITAFIPAKNPTKEIEKSSSDVTEKTVTEKQTEPDPQTIDSHISADYNNGLQTRSISNENAANITSEQRCSTRERRTTKRLIAEA